MEDTYKNELYLEYIFAHCAAPVAAGRKPSSLMTIWKHRINTMNLKEYIATQGSQAVKGCRLEILMETPLYYLLFCYRESLLQKELEKTKDSVMLIEYPICLGVRQCIGILKNKICEYEQKKTAFPHEVGIFLGYPVWDVEGFITNKGQNYKICGYWKVYEDVPGALSRFEEYDRLKMEAVHLFWERNGYCSRTTIP